MPIVGERQTRKPGASGYSIDTMAATAKQFGDMVKGILEDTRLELYTEPTKALRNPIVEQTMKSYFLENSADPNGFADTDAYEDHLAMMEQTFENDRQGILEHSHPADHNPVIGMTFPIHKNIMMKNIFDKGAIPKFVAASPKFTLSMETRWLIDPTTGEKIDMWKEQWKMTDAIEKAAPLKSIYLPLPEQMNTNIIETMFGVPEDLDTSLSIESKITGLIGKRVVYPGQTIDLVISETDTNVTPNTVTYVTIPYKNTTTTAYVLPTQTPSDLSGQLPTVPTGVTIAVVGAVFAWEGKFAPAYGTYDRQLAEEFALPMVTSVAAGTQPGHRCSGTGPHSTSFLPGEWTSRNWHSV